MLIVSKAGIRRRASHPALREADRLQKDLAKHLRSELEALRGRAPMGDLTALAQAGIEEELLRVIELPEMRLSFDGMAPKLLEAAQAGAATAAAKLGARVVLDGTRPRLLHWLQTHLDELSTQLVNTNAAGLKATLRAGIAQGRHPRRIAMDLRNSIGLNEPQSIAAAHRREQLAANPKLSAERANALGDKYTEQLLRQRADMIARTESLTAVNQGRSELWDQLKDGGAMPAEQRKEWDASGDRAVCTICNSMHGKQATVGSSWELPDGSVVKVPNQCHPNCRCVENLV